MKHLTTLLLTLLILGGCSSELDRCIEANTHEDNRQRKLDEFFDKYKWDISTWMGNHVEIEEKRRRLQLQSSEVTYNPLEEAIWLCEDKYWQTFANNFVTRKGITRKQLADNYTNYKDEIDDLYDDEACKHIETDFYNKAVSLCHAQGIY